MSRNTPTCVGKTPCHNISMDILRKHPHVRGEDSPMSRKVTRILETPPRAWGRQEGQAAKGADGRNTPTCVGKTSRLAILARAYWKHPHVRGEDSQPAKANPSGSETPPRAWGRPSSHIGQTYFLRNTPTCVGKTLRDYSLFLLSRQNNIETSSFSDTSCSPDNSMSWRFGSPMP